MIHHGVLDVEEGQLFWELRPASRVDARALTRPSLLFIHAGVADQTLWDHQVEHFSAQGWDVIRYDRLGFGRSQPTQAYLDQRPRPKLKEHQHAAEIVRHVQSIRPGSTHHDQQKVVVVGLSMGAVISLDFTITFPHLVCGLAVIAGALSGFDHPNTSIEEEMFSREATLMDSRDVEGLVNLRVKLWGDGPLEPEGRLRNEARQHLYTWCKEIAVRELNGTGGSVLESQDLAPTAAGRLSDIKLPGAVALGTLDESSSIAAMRFVKEHTELSTLKEFKAAHMVNLEYPDDFNVWLEEWLNTHFL